MRSFRSPALLAATALMVTLAAQPLVYAGISTADSSSMNIDLTSLDAATLQENYLDLRQQLAANKAEAIQMQTLLNAGSTSVTQSQLAELKSTITQQQTKASAYETLLARMTNTTAELYKLKEDYIAARQQLALDQARLKELKASLPAGSTDARITTLQNAITANKTALANLEQQIANATPTTTQTEDPSYSGGGISTGDYGSSGGSGSAGGGFGEALQSAITAGLMQNMMGGGGIQGLLGGQATMPGMGNTDTPDLSTFAAKPTPAKPKTEAEKKKEEEKEKKAKKCQPSATTDTAPGKAADDAIGGAEASKTAADKAKAAQDDCTEIDVGAKEPESKETGKDDSNFEGKEGNKYGLDTKEKIDQFIKDRNGRPIGKNGECASFPRTDIPHSTATWREGTQVTQDNQPAVGTWVATFNNDDKYGTNTEIYGKSRFSHTGMFYGYDTDGSLLLADQFNGGALKVRKYSCNGGLQSCNSFHTIKTPGNSFNMFRSPLLQTLEFAYNLTKNYSPLSKS